MWPSSFPSSVLLKWSSDELNALKVGNCFMMHLRILSCCIYKMQVIVLFLNSNYKFLSHDLELFRLQSPDRRINSGSTQHDERDRRPIPHKNSTSQEQLYLKKTRAYHPVCCEHQQTALKTHHPSSQPGTHQPILPY